MLPKSKELFTEPDTSLLYSAILSFKQPWEILGELKEYILDTGSHLPQDKYHKYGDAIWISRRARVSDLATIHGPCIIMEGCDIRPGAFLRGGVLVGRGSVVGNSTELKNSILFDRVQVPHFNYVGDSILGYKAHLGAGSVTSNVKSDKSPITIATPDGRIVTERTKLGAIVGDCVEVGCGAVLCPGTIIGKNSIIYPLCRIRGYVEAGRRVKESYSSGSSRS